VDTAKYCEVHKRKVYILKFPHCWHRSSRQKCVIFI